MSKAFQIFNKHQTSIIFFVLYTLLWLHYLHLSNQFRMDQSQGKSSVSYGEGLAYTLLFILMIGFLFGLFLIIRAVVKGGEWSYYLIMAALAFGPAVYCIAYFFLFQLG